jgi:hypothetical protein
MKTKKITLLCLMILTISFCQSPTENEPEKEEIVIEKGKHLFILSGQSNMARLKPEDSFIPSVKKKFGDENVIVVKSANSGQPIRRWYKDWTPLVGNTPKASGDLYDRLMDLVYPAIKNEKIETVTFIWMQGEKDAKEKYGEVYGKSLLGLYDQLRIDLSRTDMNFVIGRLNDFDMQNETYQHWTMIRDIQVKVADSNLRFDWINTDDLNDGNYNGQIFVNDLHMSTQGYITMGERFAEKSIQLIENN